MDLFRPSLGGIALALLKLIDARFYVGATSPVEVQAAYFTYGAYMALGGLAAVFLADHDLPPRKIVRSAFVIGLLAPSLLLALVSQPVNVSRSPQDAEKAIPRLSLIPLATAIAEEPSVRPPATAGNPPTVRPADQVIDVRVVPRKDLEPTLIEAIGVALGRKGMAEKYVYVLGSTSDKQKAVQTAAMASSALNWKVPASVIQVEGTEVYFVTVGGFIDRESALQLKVESASSAAKRVATGWYGNIQAVPPASRNELAALFADGPVVKVQALLEVR